jgi:hypothetical protein
MFGRQIPPLLVLVSSKEKWLPIVHRHNKKLTGILLNRIP